MVVDGALGSLAGGLEKVDGTLGKSAVVGRSVLVTLEKMSLSVVSAWRVWVSGGGSRGRR